MGRQTHHQRTVHAGWTVEGNDEAHPTALSTDWQWQKHSLEEMEKKRPPHGGSGGGRTVKKSRGGNKNRILRRRHFSVLCAEVADCPPLGGRYNLTDELDATDLDPGIPDRWAGLKRRLRAEKPLFFFTLFLDLVLRGAL